MKSTLGIYFAQVGSMENYNHQPGGGNVKIIHKPLDLKVVKSKVGSMDNSKHIPKGGKRKIKQYEVRQRLIANVF